MAEPPRKLVRGRKHNERRETTRAIASLRRRICARHLRCGKVIADTASTYEGTKTILNNYFMPKINVQMEIYNFRKCHQRDDQSLDEYATELRQLGRNCNFNDVDGEMLSQIIQHCRSNRLRRRALRENDKSLSDILTLGRSLELSDRQANKIESKQKHDVHRVFEKRGNKTGNVIHKCHQTRKLVKNRDTNHNICITHHTLVMTNVETVGGTTLMLKVVRQRGNYAISDRNKEIISLVQRTSATSKSLVRGSPHLSNK